MEIIDVNTQSKNYPIYIGNNFDNLAFAFKKASLKGKKTMIVTDNNVAKLYLEEVKNILGEISDVSVFVFPSGEESKSFETLMKLYSALMEARFERDSLLVALGGGVTGDLTGFGAATYLRGIKFAQIPTTLMAQVDSSIGGKTGVDFQGGKNLIGSFHQPELVYTNCETLKTLPEEEILSGLSEIIKYGFIFDKDFLRFLEIQEKSIKNLDNEALSYIIKLSCKIKANIVAIDERESGIREILNFGHTFGHGIESLSGFTISHGKSVALGMICALYLSKIKYFISELEYEESKNLLENYGFPMKTSFGSKEIYEKMFLDKKIKDSKLKLILLESVGRAFSTTEISEMEILNAINEIL